MLCLKFGLIYNTLSKILDLREFLFIFLSDIIKGSIGRFNSGELLLKLFFITGYLSEISLDSMLEP